MEPLDNQPDGPERNSGRKKSGKSKKPEIPNEVELISGALAGELVSAHGGTSILRHIRVLHNLYEEKRNPLDALQIDGLEKPEIVRFLTSDHPSHFSKIEGLKEQLERSKRTVNLLDETDFSGKTLYEFIPQDLQKEIEDQLKGMEDLTTIQETLEAEVSVHCGDLWDEYKKLKKKTADTQHKTLELLLLGPEDEDANDSKGRKDLESVRGQMEKIRSVGELVQLEKMRLVTRALTASPKDYPKFKQEAEQVLGSEFEMIAAQVQFMEDQMHRDLEASDPDIGPMDHTEGLDLLCEDIKSRMVDAEGKENPSLNADQKDALEAAYSNALFTHKPNESREDKLNRKISFILAASETIASGKEALFANSLKMIREMEAPEKTQNDPTDPNLADKLGDAADNARNQGERLKKSLGTILKTWPKVMMVGAGGMLCKSLKGQMGHRSMGFEFIKSRHKNLHGSQQDLIEEFALAHTELNQVL